MCFTYFLCRQELSDVVSQWLITLLPVYGMQIVGPLSDKSGPFLLIPHIVALNFRHIVIAHSSANFPDDNQT